MILSTEVNYESIVGSHDHPYNGVEVVFVKEIHIASAVLEGRKRKNITQEDLARYMGVSKASVSKWETGQSYPDITFLPQLATFFDISIDDLMGYAPQMTKEEIRNLYHQLSREFSTLPFATVMDRCREVVKKYYSCYPLLLQMTVLLLNYSNMAETEELQREIVGDIQGLCLRIKTESDDLSLKKQANFFEAICALSLGSPAQVIDLLEPVNAPWLGDEVIAASAHYALGNIDKAKEVSQVAVFQHLMAMFGILPNFLMFSTDDAEKYDQIMARTLALIEIFEVRSLHPAILFALYLTGAQGYLVLGEETKALDILEQYADLATADIYPIEFSGDSFFDQVNAWFADFDLGVKPPRDDVSIRAGMGDALTKNPAFSHLAENDRFQNMVNRLERLKTRGD
ncbi:MAG TPA: helix-turn-helix transcriptional regulator [Limnochordia bacterium]|nr:helix-turn-helix transcriptional regulator [Limnochordia bacterium]